MAVTTHQPHRVYLKEHWTDEWAIQSEDGLYCDWCKFACSPDVNEAQLSRTFGPNVIRANGTVSVNADPLDIEGWYVKVDIAQDALGLFTTVRTWTGVVVVTHESRWGIQGATGEIGRQVFDCRGMEFLLQRTIVDTSAVDDPTGGVRTIGRGIAFNLGSGHGNESQRIGNRSDDIQGISYAFTATIDHDAYSKPSSQDSKLWTAEDIAEYLVDRHNPVDQSGFEPVGFLLDPATTDALKPFFPTLETHGKSVKTILDELMDRRRILTWYTDVQFDEEAESTFVYIKVATFNKDDLTLPSGQTIPANQNQANWFTDADGLYVSFDFVKDDSSFFHQVIARGEPLGVCFTLSNAEGCFDKDWTSTLQTAYRTAASGAAGYGAYQDWQKDDANQAMRNTDKFVKVYRYFAVPDSWNGQIDGREVFRDPDADPEAGLEVWFPGLRFKPQLPLITETDYATVSAVTSEMLDGSKPEYRRPFAVIHDDAAGKYYHFDKMSYGFEIESGLKTNGRTWSAHLRMQDDAFGVIVDVSGSYQHQIASADFTAIDAFDYYDASEALDWRDIQCTVFCEFDGFAQAKYPLQVVINTDVLRILYIQVPNARLDYLCPGTVIGVDDDGALLKCTGGGYVRDDREKLKDIAQSSYEWYATSRRAITAVYRSLVVSVELGDFILNTGSPTTQVVSNSVVTSLTFNLLQNTTTIQTQFAQLDLAAF